MTASCGVSLWMSECGGSRTGGGRERGAARDRIGQCLFVDVRTREGVRGGRNVQGIERRHMEHRDVSGDGRSNAMTPGCGSDGTCTTGEGMERDVRPGKRPRPAGVRW